jgi:N-acetylglucosamine-6-phosphate deacetylase
VGVLGSALLLDELYCELIADTVHVSVPAMQLLVKNKPSDKVILITDSLMAQGLPVGEYGSGGQTIVVDGTCCRLKNGTLAGTVVPMNGMIKNMVEKVGVPFTVAVDFATKNPAENLGLANKGSISIGKDADFAVVDENYEVLMTVRGGEIVYRK